MGKQRSKRAFAVVVVVGGLVALALQASASASASGTSQSSDHPSSSATSGSATAANPGDCDSSFDVYKATDALRKSCGVRGFPLQSRRPRPDGGTEYTYVVEGAVTVYDLPPANFNATRAAASELAQYGLSTDPPRGDGLSSAEWHRYLAHIHFLTPPPVIYAIPRVTAYTSPNWSGYLETGHTYTDSQSAWYEPGLFLGNCNTTKTSVVFWVGLGGWNSGLLAQNGTGENVPGLGQNQYWSEVLPQQPYVVPQNGSAPVGSEIFADTHYLGNNKFNFVFQDYTNTDYLNYTVTANGYDGSTAEQVTERPLVNGVFSNLSNFHNVLFASPYVYYPGAPYEELIQNVPHGAITMYNGSDQLTSESGLGTNDNFTVYQLRCN